MARVSGNSSPKDGNRNIIENVPDSLGYSSYLVIMVHPQRFWTAISPTRMIYMWRQRDDCNTQSPWYSRHFLIPILTFDVDATKLRMLITEVGAVICLQHSALFRMTTSIGPSSQNICVSMITLWWILLTDKKTWIQLHPTGFSMTDIQYFFLPFCPMRWCRVLGCPSFSVWRLHKKFRDLEISKYATFSLIQWTDHHFHRLYLSCWESTQGAPRQSIFTDCTPFSEEW